MLFGEYEVVEEFTAFLCKACFASFSFAHRIVWFLKSMMHQNNPHNHKIRQILNIIQTIFKSEDKKNILERLHVAGSKKFVECLHKTNMIEIYQYLTESNLKDLNACFFSIRTGLKLLKIYCFFQFFKQELANFHPSSSVS